MSGGRAPQWRLMALDKTTDYKNEVGLGWSGEHGVSVRLKPGVVLDWRDGDRLVLTLFPIDEGGSEHATRKRRTKKSERGQDERESAGEANIAGGAGSGESVDSESGSGSL
jgi:hypothetical protein